MEDKIINNRITEIFNLFSQLIVMQIQALYDEYEDMELCEIEEEYKHKYKNLIDRSIKNIDIYCKIKEFIFSEVDYYGLDTRENDIKSDIENFFYDFSKNLSVESMIMRDKWKRKQVGELQESVSFLNDTIKKLREKQQILEQDFESVKMKSKVLSQELDRTKEKEIEKTEETKKLKAELEHLRKGINLLQSQIKEKEILKEKILNDKNKLSDEYNKVLNKNNEMKKEIEKLKIEKVNLSNNINKTKLSIKEAKTQFNDIYNKSVFVELKRIVSDTNIVQGKNTRDLVSAINKNASSFRSLDALDDINKLLSDLIIKLNNLHNLLENNSQESKLDQYIEELKKLKEKI